MLPVSKSLMAFLWEHGDQLADSRFHATHDLHTVGAVKSNFVESQAQEILPARKGYENAGAVIRVAKHADLQTATTETE